jgi:hypothetical protein
MDYLFTRKEERGCKELPVVVIDGENGGRGRLQSIYSRALRGIRVEVNADWRIVAVRFEPIEREEVLLYW